MRNDTREERRKTRLPPAKIIAMIVLRLPRSLLGVGVVSRVAPFKNATQNSLHLPPLPGPIGKDQKGFHKRGIHDQGDF